MKPGATGKLVDLTDAVRMAASGRLADTEALCEQLRRGRLLLALRRPLADADPVDVVLARPGAVDLHHRQMAGSRAGAVFTNPELLESAAGRYGWTTGRGALQHIALPANLALQLLIQKREAAGLAGVHVNPPQRPGVAPRLVRGERAHDR